MNMNNAIDIRIKPQFIKNYLDGYPLISKDAIVDWSKVKTEGTIVNLFDNRNKFIAKGYYGIQNKGYGWVLSSKKEESIDIKYFAHKINAALQCREVFFNDEQTTAFRVFNG